VGTVFRSHPAGVPQLGTVESVAFSRDDLQRFHRECYRPGGSMLAISGDVDPERAFMSPPNTSAHGRERARDQVPAPQPPEPGKIRLVDPTGLADGRIRIGLPLPGTGASDVAALAVANEILGGASDRVFLPWLVPMGLATVQLPRTGHALDLGLGPGRVHRAVITRLESEHRAQPAAAERQ
jgi:predicted Zn-dependent peptidase